MTRTDILKDCEAVNLIKHFIERFGVKAGVFRAARELGASVYAINEARRFF